MNHRYLIIASAIASAAAAGCSLNTDRPAGEEHPAATRASTQGLSVQVLPRPEGTLLAQIPATAETISESGGLVQAWQVYPYRSTVRAADATAAVGAYVVGIDPQGGVHSVLRARSMSNGASALEVASLTGDLGDRAMLVQLDTAGVAVVPPAASAVAARAVRDFSAYEPPYREPSECPARQLRCVPRDANAHRTAEMQLAGVKIGIAAAQLARARGADPRAWTELGQAILELVVAEGTIPDQLSKTDWNQMYNQTLNAVGLGKDPLAVLYRDDAFMRSIGVNIPDPWAFKPPSVVDSFGLPLVFGVQSGMLSPEMGSLFTSGFNNPSWADTGGSLGIGFYDLGGSSFGSWGGGFLGGGGGGGGLLNFMLF